MGTPEVELDGFREARRALKAIGAKAGTDIIKDVNKEAGEFVAERARGRANRVKVRSQANGRPLDALYGRMARTGIRTSRKQTASSIRIGSKSQPWAVGLEYGAKRWRQFGPYTGSGSGRQLGYVVRPAIRESTDEVADLYRRRYAEAIEREVPGMIHRRR